MAKSYDVAVIGAGVFGAWTAYWLRRAGAQVLLVDAYGPGNSRASSGGESRMIRLGYGPDEIYTRSAQRSLELWKELFAEVGPHAAQPLQTTLSTIRASVARSACRSRLVRNPAGKSCLQRLGHTRRRCFKTRAFCG